jgi:hypothetical protein
MEKMRVEGETRRRAVRVMRGEWSGGEDASRRRNKKGSR